MNRLICSSMRLLTISLFVAVLFTLGCASSGSRSTTVGGNGGCAACGS